MHYSKRKNLDGTYYYRFIHYNPKTKKPEPMTREEIRKRFGKDILTEEEAKECCKLLDAKFESEKIRIQRRITWEAEFYHFATLLEQYREKQKKRAPNSWQNNVFYLKHYVLFYFLQVRRLNNIDLWSDHFEDFKTWLETAKKVRGKGQIAFSSKNHAIKSLNTFLDHLLREKIITYTIRCEAFGEHLLNSRTIDDVVQPNEMEAVYRALVSEGHKEESLLFRFLYFSGMRFNEALAVSVGDLYQGVMKSDFLRQKLTAYEIPYHGYVVAEGQFGKVLENGHVIRLPFKGRKKIEEKYNRVFPIIDKILWNALVELAGSKHDPNRSSKDLLLFPNINDSTASVRLIEAFAKAKLKHRSWHCLRHSRATYLIGQTSDAMLARIWLGHSSPRTIEKYNHMYQAIVRSETAEALTGREFGLTKV